MELVLNLVWVLLAVPAFWLWRKAAKGQHQHRCGFACFLALSCVVVLLFPVISATDDLHALRAEMEEPGPNKRGVRAGDRLIGSSHQRAEAALAVYRLPFARNFFSRVERPRPTRTIHSYAPDRAAGRAPPAFSLA